MAIEGRQTVETRPKARARGDVSADASPSHSAARQPARVVARLVPALGARIRRLYFAGTTCVFLLHGNVHDLIRQERGGRRGLRRPVTEFLATQLFGTWDVVLRHDLSQGLRRLAGGDADRLRRMTVSSSERIGEPKSWPRDPDAVLALLDQLVRRS